ncbi:hypothetical protein CKAN_01993100 [Cinnamomum micranthum f. kanehirae]|uniref:Uncharacterized protein n=1 Tax=Cinnamomum micranthum f. kanehirae TaxID=337451 RepID=A0A3S3N223_9MAGN|nr:hypothetical protein CKAN_01993100 [Cinnamomum micranthum f. kanehirae]
MFYLLLLKFDETIIKEILGVHRHLLRTSVGLNVFPILPNIASIIFRKCWKEEVLQIQHEKLKLLDQLIRARKDNKTRPPRRK